MKRVLCLLLCCLVVWAVFPRLPARADDDFLMCAIENTFLEDVTEGGRASYIGGSIYIPYSALDGLSGVKAYYNERLQQLFVYTLDLRMTFDMANEQTYDTNGDFYPPLAVRRGGTIFVPIQMICDRFELYFSFTPAGRICDAPVIRICAVRPTLSDALLFSRSATLIETIYDNYQAYINPVIPSDPGPGPGRDPTPAPLLTYLLFEGPLTAETPAILDELSDRGCPAAFFLPAEDPAAEPDLLRRLYAQDYTLGLLLTDVPEDPAALLREANARLCGVVHAKTRLVRVAAGADTLTEGQREAIVAAGFRLWDANLDPLADESDAEELLRLARRMLARTSRTAVIRLSSNPAVLETLPALCRWMDNNNRAVLSINEWDDPINAANELR